MGESVRPVPPRFRLLIAGCLVSALGLMVAPAAAQILYGGVVGIVKDSTGARLPGATVTIINKDTNLTREVTTDAEGAYNLVNVQAGAYDLKVSLQGFREVVRSRVPVTIGEISRVGVSLEIGTLWGTGTGG